MKNGIIKEYCKYGKRDSVQEELEQYGFYRVHQSYLVNMKYVKNVERYEASLENGMTINISKRYYKDVEREYIKQQGEKEEKQRQLSGGELPAYVIGIGNVVDMA